MSLELNISIYRNFSKLRQSYALATVYHFQHFGTMIVVCKINKPTSMICLLLNMKHP